MIIWPPAEKSALTLWEWNLHRPLDGSCFPHQYCSWVTYTGLLTLLPSSLLGTPACTSLKGCCGPFFLVILCCESPKDMKEACAVAKDTVITEKTHTYECRLTESKICVDNTSRGLLLTERQVRAPLCGNCGTKLLKSWPFGQFTVYTQKRSLHSEVKIALRNEVGDADSSMTNFVLTVEGWWKSLNSMFMVGRILLWQQYYFSEEKYA